MAVHRDPITVNCLILSTVHLFRGREEVFKTIILLNNRINFRIPELDFRTCQLCFG